MGSFYGNNRNRIGNVQEGNYTEFFSDGTMRRRGDATTWKDMIANLYSSKLYANQGKVDYDDSSLSIKFQSGGSITNDVDLVAGNHEINHEFQKGLGVVFKPHFHWFQKNTTPFVMTMQWRIINNGNSFDSTAPWTEVTTTCGTHIGNGGQDIWEFVLEAGHDTFNQITRLPDIVVDCNVSDTIQIKLARTDTESGDMFIYFLDIHAKVDSDGSDEETAKA